MLAALDGVGNPSSVHAAGRAARRLLEDARDVAGPAASAGRWCSPPAGTEADALAIHALGHRRRLLVGVPPSTTPSAWPAADAEALPVDGDGRLRLDDALQAALPGGTPALVCLMLANNETGTIQPVAEAAALCKRYGARLHVDAVQAAGRIPTDLRSPAAQPAWRSPRTSWAARRVPARCCWRRTWTARP